jgi:hypothetical protein
MASGFTRPTEIEGKGAKTVAKGGTKKASKKPSEALKGGPGGGMHDFEGVGTQKPGVSSVSKGNTKGKFAAGGPGGQMQKFTGVKPQKPGVSSVTNSGGGGNKYAKS